jgi:hypothetical protein
MESIHLTQKVRPLRLLFLVSENSEDQALFAFQLNCALWGGMLNPVVSVEQGEEFVVRPESWTPGIINKPKLRKGCPDAKAPQVHT